MCPESLAKAWEPGVNRNQPGEVLCFCGIGIPVNHLHFSYHTHDVAIFIFTVLQSMVKLKGGGSLNMGYM